MLRSWTMKTVLLSRLEKRDGFALIKQGEAAGRRSPLAQKKKLTSVAFANASTGWIGGDDGLLLKTTTAGVKWKAQKTKTDKNINGIYPTSAAVCGSPGRAVWSRKARMEERHGARLTQEQVRRFSQSTFRKTPLELSAEKWTLLRATRDGGTTWGDVETEKNATIRSIDCLGKGLCYGVGDKGTLFPFDIEEDENEGSAASDESNDDDDDNANEAQHSAEPMPDPRNLRPFFGTDGKFSYTMKNLGTVDAPHSLLTPVAQS